MKEPSSVPCTGDAHGECLRCGRLPSRSMSSGFGVVIWPPAGHVRDHIRRVAQRQDITLEPAGYNEALTWATTDADALAGFVDRLVAELSPIEAADVRIFLGPPDTFGIAHGRHVTSLPDAHARLRADWLLDLLEGQRLVSWMQPLFLAADSTLDGYEFLLRGLDADGGIIAPGPMFDVARRADLLFQLDLAARRTAIRTAAEQGIAERIFINFTPNAIYDPAFCLRATVQLVEEAGLSPDRVIFEITEGDHEHDTDHLRAILRFYRSRGFRVALDDVGAGFATLNRLHELQPDIVKIDMAIVRGADGDPFKRTIARKLIETAQELDIQTVAEGIETEGERRYFAELGTTWLQGWHLARPAPTPWKPAP
ncbi:MAG: EAL domain-containing protein [Deltaproteobacteria bacterium]|nr:MAG: EAL domain-containing protein [Deltaproteobacteria bacterium]